MTSPLHARIVDQIREQGPITFRDFVARALYEPDLGYYARGPEIGPGGDFSTSARFPAFGRALARVTLAAWRALGRPADFQIVELGAGTGALARTILSTLAQEAPEARARYVTVDASEALRRKQAEIEGVHSCARLHDAPSGPSFVIANEVLDALPFHRVVGQEDGGILELFVEARHGRFVEVPRPPSTPALAARLKREGVRLAPGQQAEVCLEFDALFADLSRVVTRGYAMFVDYGDEADGLYTPARREGTLATYHAHARGRDPFARVGEQDVTADVDFTAVTHAATGAGFKPLARADQGAFLWGPGGLRDEAARAQASADVARLQEIAQLCMPMALGQAFEVLLFAREAPDPFAVQPL